MSDNPHGEAEETGEEGRAFRHLTVELVREAIIESAGVKTVTAKRLGCSRATLYAFLAQHEAELEGVEQMAREAMVDKAETNVISALNRGDLKTSRWFLGLQGSGRGYARRIETTGANGGPIHHSTLPPGLDLTQLSDEEVMQLHELHEKARTGSASGGNSEAGAEVPADVHPGGVAPDQPSEAS